MQVDTNRLAICEQIAGFIADCQNLRMWLEGDPALDFDRPEDIPAILRHMQSQIWADLRRHEWVGAQLRGMLLEIQACFNETMVCYTTWRRYQNKSMPEIQENNTSPQAFLIEGKTPMVLTIASGVS